jgi:hypothetical protein
MKHHKDFYECVVYCVISTRKAYVFLLDIMCQCVTGSPVFQVNIP